MGQMTGAMSRLRNNYWMQNLPNPSGGYRLNTNVTDEQAEQMGARVSREQFERYMNQFAPQEQALIGTLNNAAAENAAMSSQADAMRSRAALERMRQRYGTSLTGQQTRAETIQNQRATTLGALSAMNTGRQLDEDRRFNLQGTMLNIGNNLSSSAMGGLTEASNNANAREQSYQQAQAQYKAQRSQQKASTVSTIATLGTMAVLGGI